MSTHVNTSPVRTIRDLMDIFSKSRVVALVGVFHTGALIFIFMPVV